MNQLEKKELKKQVEIMSLLNKAQEISRELTRLNADAEPLKHFNTAIFELSLTPTDKIGDTVYLQYLSKVGVKTISEPKTHGWYHVSDSKI